MLQIGLLGRDRGRLVAVALALFALACETPDPESADTGPVEQTRPNIVYIMADELGYADLSSYGRTNYSTLALDRLVAESTRFAQAYAIAPVCSPTRVGLMTGRYPARTRAGIFEPLRADFPNEGLDPGGTALFSRLRAAGYSTGMVGKWHLGRNAEFWPLAQGFEHWFSTLSGGRTMCPTRRPRPPNRTALTTCIKTAKSITWRATTPNCSGTRQLLSCEQPRHRSFSIWSTTRRTGRGSSLETPPILRALTP